METPKMIKDYLMAGGKAIISVDYNAEKLPNLLSILKYYGIEMVNGIVLEKDMICNFFLLGIPFEFYYLLRRQDV